MHFVKARSAAGPGCQGRIRLHRDVENVVDLSQVIRNLKTKRWSELVVGVQRRNVAAAAPLLLENALSPERVLIERVRVGWWLERVNKERQGVKLLVAVAKEICILAAKIAKPRNGLQ